MAFVADSKDVLQELAILNDPLYRAAAPNVANWLRALRQAKTAVDYFALHRQLLVEFGARQEVVDEFGRKKTEIRARIGDVARSSTKDIASIRKYQAELSAVEHRSSVQNALLQILRMLGDALVWQVLRFDRTAVAVLGDGQRVGRLSSGEGRRKELETLGALWDEHRTFAILNDLTNCLRRGDITSVSGIEDHALTVGVAEIKLAGEPPESSPQVQRIFDAVELLNTGEHATFAAGERLRVLRPPIRYRTYLSHLATCVRLAHDRGLVGDRPHPAMAVFAIDFRRYAGRTDEIDRDRLAVERELGWFEDDTEVFQYVSSLRLMRDRRHSFSYLAPLTIYPLPVEDVVDLTFGFVNVVPFMHMTLMEQALSVGSLEVKLARPPESNDVFLVARDERARVTVPPQLREQMLLELMTPSCMRKAVQCVFQAARDGTQHSFVAFADEGRVWGRP